MRLVVKILDTEVLSIELGGTAADTEETKVGDATSTPIGFSPSWGDQAWEQGVER